ncbi:MAG: acetyl-CoA carboxylase carboxyltransferase subunit alpha [Verrucomicrobiae bacterium]|nr:acetyl-CoA carboxylase carboxyltransferase subunit alpha [Verrucomicrobiae bacterium]
MKVTPLEFEKPIVELEKKLQDMLAHVDEHKIDFEQEKTMLENKIEQTRREIYESLTPWQRVQIARHNRRPYSLDYMTHVLTDFIELHGDRRYSDDKAIVGGFARLEGERVMAVGHQKGRDAKENVKRNFGMSHPEGYRKAMRLMELAGRFGLPIITFIDTAGAYPGVGAEERHISEAIAVNLREMTQLPVPTLGVVIGEGGSGGALGIGVCDRILILENAYYSVISPEGCAAILWKDRKFAAQAAEALKMSARDLRGLNLVDEVVPEPMGGAHHHPAEVYANVKKALVKNLASLKKLSLEDLLDQRYAKYRDMGEYQE